MLGITEVNANPVCMSDLPKGKGNALPPLPKPSKPLAIETQEPLTLWKQTTSEALQVLPAVAPYIEQGWSVQLVPQQAFERLQKLLKSPRPFQVIRLYTVRRDGRTTTQVALLCQPGFNPSKGLKGASNPRAGKKVRLAPEQRTVINKSYKLNQPLKATIAALLIGFTGSNAECNALIRQGLEALTTAPASWEATNLPPLQTDWGEAMNQTFAIRFNQLQWAQVDGLRREDETSTSLLLRRLLYVGALAASKL